MLYPLVPLGVAQALTASSIARGNSREAITVCIARQTTLILAIGIARTLTAFPVVMSVPLADVAAALVAMAMRVSQTHRPSNQQQFSRWRTRHQDATPPFI